jgi:hypothetical protein
MHVLEQKEPEHRVRNYETTSALDSGNGKKAHVVPTMAMTDETITRNQSKILSPSEISFPKILR